MEQHALHHGAEGPEIAGQALQSIGVGRDVGQRAGLRVPGPLLLRR
jgi:hypothetical protein